MKVPNCRYPLILSSLVAALALAGCKGDVLDYRNAQLVNGKVYAGNANEPFSGKLTNVPADKLLGQQPGFRQISAAILNTGALIPGDPREAQSLIGSGNAVLLMLTPHALCDVNIDEGLPNGNATCSDPNGGAKRIEARFKNGTLDDRFALFNTSGDHQLVDVTLNNGHPDGKMAIYSSSNATLVHVAHWQDGALSGDEEAFDPNTGNRVLTATLINGKYDGAFARYASDGKQVIYKATFAHGTQQGTEESFDPNTGKLTGHAEYVDGKLSGEVKRWNADGKLIYEKTYQNGQEMPASNEVKTCVDEQLHSLDNMNGVGVDRLNDLEATCKEKLRGGLNSAAPSATTAGSADNDICVSIWTAAFHRENGDEATVTADQLNEWRSWCKAGKRPS